MVFLSLLTIPKPLQLEYFNNSRGLFDQTLDERTLNCLILIDELSRLELAISVCMSFRSGQVTDTIDVFSQL